MRRGRNNSGIVGWVLVVLVLSAVGFMGFSPLFEKDDPKVSLSQDGYWNFRDPIHVSVEDTSGLKSFKATIVTPHEEWVVAEENAKSSETKKVFDILPPKGVRRVEATSIVLKIEATDNSLWGLFMGNTYKEEITLIIDQRRPVLAIVANSYKIQKGGSAIVIFKAEDPHMQSLKIETSFGKTFVAQPFMKEGYYASLVAWPVQEQTFSATVVARDRAGNETKSAIPLRLKDHVYRVSNIELSDAFLDGKIAELANEYEQTAGVDDRLEQFRIINEKVRADNEKIIHDITSKVSKNMILDFTPEPFYPLVNGQKVADFGDHRIYSYKGQENVSQAYHMGLDLASVAMGPITSSNGGNVVFSQPNGIYGNLPIIDHGFGLYTLYGHCSEVHVQEGDVAALGQEIAKTGLSGYAMGDHLHFGILVQGIEVRPEEWMDTKWIYDNITSVIENAKVIINQR
ncbi:MAG: peptidase M23 [Sulfuricurvum sp. GWF2_44_89]|uniref:Peptidase M23 n=1 Tax=Sulfuricurvum kujiense TaxID=148813 RepID=A0A2D3WEZ8_9BACT|nr:MULTISPECIES: M23 family metallopeptidase [Sulfuricurvum]OHD78754.1 MAG: peptidase M23 [Sulfuricurvum sp. GWF2_44_89]OHD91931.1 MAG: peptidase M23 [Sulfuricurvum sp. RIFOXYD12_FULL_44_77]OHD95970.1 MAG: peptidase M23 [Sulfuricurvum sp. RIFOXYD2_FULL_44_160]DAB38998.1 MAG TPA: peptidase M23 [Sulfuricurvum kujiense]